MKWIAPTFLVFACFTAPHGDLGIWVEKSQIVAIEHATACDPAANSQIVTTQGTLCVKETPQQALTIYDKLKDDTK